MLAELIGAARERAFGGVDVALHLGERDRTLGERAVVVEDGIVRILPALIDETVVVLPVVFDEAVMIGIAGAGDPGERCFDRGP